MLVGFFIFIVATVTTVQLVFNAPVKTTEEPTTQPTSADTTVIEKELPTVPPYTPTPTPTSVTPSLSAAQQTNTQPGGTASIDRTTLYSLINAHRKEHNLSELQVHAALEQSANKKLQEMIAEKYWQHENRAGKTSWYLFEQSGYHYSDAGENLSFGNNTAWNVFNAWVNSPNHNAQMLTGVYENMGAAADCGTYKEAGEVSCVVVLHLGKQSY